MNNTQFICYSIALLEIGIIAGNAFNVVWIALWTIIVAAVSLVIGAVGFIYLLGNDEQK